MIEIPTAFIVVLAAYAVLLVVGAGLLATVATETLVAHRRVRVARGETIAAHYFGLAHSH